MDAEHIDRGNLMMRDWRTFDWWVSRRAKCNNPECNHAWIIQEDEEITNEKRADGGIAFVAFACPRCGNTVGLERPPGD
jgi:predicted RNA-binding Zn-ribbon protein involved in translation (DUF1610 family)